MARAARARSPKAPPPDDALPIDNLLRDAGFDTAAALRAARAALEVAGLTRPGKRGIASEKRDRALAELAQRLMRVCGKACAALATGRRTAVITTGSTCEVCAGSNNRRAALAAARVLDAAGVRHMLVVGGTAQQQRDLADLLASPRLRMDFVDGTRSHTQKDAIANMNRAQLLIIWGSTPLKHAVSNLYTAEPPAHLRAITVARRGIEAVCREIVRSYAAKPT